MKRILALTFHGLLFTALLLSACQSNSPAPAAAGSDGSADPPAAAGAPATAAPNDVTGPGGGSVVTASDGVILLTPGAPLPTPDVSDLLAELHAFAAADLAADPLEEGDSSGAPPAEPAGPVDPAGIELPEGISLLADAADFQLSPEGESMQYVVFYTGEDPAAILEIYAQQAEQGGYSNISLELPNARGEFDGSWMKRGMLLTVTAYPGDRTKVMIAWMAM